MKVSAFVQTIPKRLHLAKRLESRLIESDLDSVHVLIQKPEHNAWDHFFYVLERMAESDADLVIRLEDDAIINPYLKYNCERWPAIARKEFGIGWLYSSPTNIHDYIYRRRLRPICRKRWLDGTVANLFRREDLPWIIEHSKRWAERHPNGYAYDFCLSEVLYNAGRELWLHDPPLVEHDLRVQSSMGHVVTPRCSTMGAFSAVFRRGFRNFNPKPMPPIEHLPKVVRARPVEIKPPVVVAAPSIATPEPPAVHAARKGQYTAETAQRRFARYAKKKPQRSNQIIE